MLDINKLNTALTLLDGKLKQKKAGPVNLVVCGGSSLIITGLISRTTMDVDILAFAKLVGPGQVLIIPADTLSQELVESAKEVARDLGLSEKWLNNMPHEEANFGLPIGFEERLQSHSYGEVLTIYFIGRLDQIHFKLHAAVDQGMGRHVNDLLALNPTPAEMELAARWVLTQDAGVQFPDVLKQALRKIGYGTVADRI